MKPSAASLPRSGSPRAWLLALRPRTLPASIAPVLLGWGVAAGEGNAPVHLMLSCLLVAVSLQAAANLANDYYDARSGVDRSDRLGPVRATQAGILRARHVFIGFVICLALGSLAGLYAAWHSGWMLLLPGAACLLGAIAYTGGPMPLSRIGLGEAAAFLFFGPVACTGTVIVLTGLPPSSTAWLAGLVPGLHAAALMAVNNLRDWKQDARAAKMTLAVRLGERRARLLVLACLLLGNLSTAFAGAAAGQPLVYIELLLLPLSWPLLRAIMKTPISEELNDLLADVGRWLFLTCVVLAALLYF